MRLDWNDIRARAAEFSRDWHDAAYEKGETQSFYNDFFEVFGVPRRRVASFERAVKPRPGERGFIDLFWPGKLLVEQKSAGRDLKPAKKQALDYFPGLRDDELPRYVRRARGRACPLRHHWPSATGGRTERETAVLVRRD